MNGGTLSLPATNAATRRSPSGSAFAEFMLVGGATLFLFPLGWLLRRVTGLDAAEYAVGFTTFYGAYLVNDPHFSVTYFLFYRGARRRAFGRELPLAYRLRYLTAGFVVPALLVLWASLALAFRSAQTLGWMVQLMFLLVGWHYVKQGFGVFAVLSARRGARVSPRERAILLGHCFAGWAYAWASPAIAAGEFEEKGVVYRAAAHPRWLELGAGGLLALSTVALVWMLATKWRRERRTFPLAPLSGLLITVWSWTVYSSIDPLMRYVIPALHSVQYLYFVWLMKRGEAREAEASFGPPVWARLTLLAASSLGLAWFLFHGAPGFLDGAFLSRSRSHGRHAVIDALGETPFLAAFFVIMNVHHYFMDNVIWRRENPDTRYLRDPDLTLQS